MSEDYPSDAPIYLTGPTGCGKTSLSLAMISQSATPIEIVCGDAYQLYDGLEILSAAPTEAEKAVVPHHLFGSVSLDREMDAAQYASMAKPKIAEIISRGVTPLVIGGSGLYLKALTHGLADLPPGDLELRGELDKLSLEALVEKYIALDPIGAAETNLKNRRYVTRNLEITMLSGIPASAQKATFAAQTPDIRAVTVVREREELYDRINARTHQMFEEGLVEEIGGLAEVPLSKTAERAIGVREVRQVLSGESSRDAAIEQIQQTTRRYAKRQLNWFRREVFPQVNLSTTEAADAARSILEFDLECE